MAIFPYIVASLAAAIFVQAGHIEKRGTVGNSHIVGLAAAVPSGTTGTIYKTYQPYLKVVHGCVPYPGVDASGNTNEGLEPTGGSNSGCGSSIGQVYVRGATAGKHYGLMYIWYMPKDEPSFGLGHRHEWEGVIVWLSSSTATTATNIVAVCPSAHGGWNCNTTTGFFLSGTSPLIKYDSPWPINHQLFQTNMVGGKQPLVAWESMSLTVRSALEHAKFGVATVPFKDSTFEINLAKAKF
ncbi:necrosis- and ethylene-inducing protein 2 precursor [Venturia nashicola]|nr:necrosis- and ethylene-inducing protein 2 precursor [Venturia nashicola]